MIFLTFLFQLLIIFASQIIDKTIYLIQGEEYKVNLDSIFKEEKENTYLFQSDNKGFILDTSSLKLISDQGAYSISNNYSNNEEPTRILRERQLINLDDYQGLGQFGILDQYDSGHRICYNSDSIINLDQCIELDNTATSYDFVFIDRNTIALSKIRVADQQFGVTIYRNMEIISELYFVPSKTYTQIHKTIIEYFISEEKMYLLFGVTEEDSKIEFLEIQDNLQIVMDKSQLPYNLDVSHVLDIKGGQNKVFLECKSSLITLKFQKQKIQYISQKRGSLELGYSYIKQSVNETYLVYYQDQYTINSNHGSFISDYFERQIKPDAQVKYTLNYLIVLQDNVIFVTTLYKSAQRTNIIEGTLLKIDVDFQNDILIVFTDSKIMTYYLKQATLSYSSHKITKNLDLVTIQAGEQLANIRFQVLSKEDYNLYSLQDLSQDLYYNLQSTQFKIPLNSISGGDIKVEAKVDDQIEISNYLPKHRLQTFEKLKEPVILERLLYTNYHTYLFRQFDDFSYKVNECQLNIQSDYKCYNTLIQNSSQNQIVIFQTTQVKQDKVQFALLNSDGLEINIFIDNIKKLISLANQTVDMKVGIDRLFLYTICDIQFYHFPSGEFISQFDLSQFGQQKVELIRKLWVNEAKTNLIIITYGEDIIVGRYTTRFIFIQRITIKWVIDVSIINDNKFIVLSTDKTTKRLTQYILEEGTIRIQRELDTHGYIITGDKIITDFVQESIIIQAQKGQQKALLVFGNTELARDSLLQVINLQDNELVENVVQNGNKSSLLIRATDPKNNSTIVDLNYTHYGIDCNLTKIPTKFISQLDLKYIYKSQFSQNKIETKKYFFLEYQFQNITVKQSNVTITYQNQLKIPINTDIFQGHVERLYYKPENSDIELITRFKNTKPFISFDDFNECQQVISFQRIICLGSFKITYLSIDGITLSSIKLDSIKRTGYFKQMVLRDDGQYALIRTEKKMMLVHISQNEIQLFQTNDQIIMLDIFIFHKDWLIVYNNQLDYFKLIIGNDSWQIQKQNELQIHGIQAIQYDPITEQIFYFTGDQNLYYFRSSLEGDTIDEQYSINLSRFLKSFNIHQVDARVQYIKIIQQYNKSYLLVSTSYGQVWNISINSLAQDFQLNNMYIVGRSSQVYDIQIIDDYVLIQNIENQVLYKNLDRPNLGIESIFAQQIIGLFKKGQQIIHIFGYSRGMGFDQNNIDDEVFLTIKNLSQSVQICAANGYQQVQVNYSLVFQHNVENQSDILKIIIIIIVIALIYYVYKERKQRQQPLIAGQNNLEMVQR